MPKRTSTTPTGSAQIHAQGFDGNFKRFLVVIAIFTLSNFDRRLFSCFVPRKPASRRFILPLLWMTLHVSKVVSSLIGGDLSDRIGRKVMIVSGWLIYAFVYVGFAFATEPWHAWVLFIIYGAYFGLTEGVERRSSRIWSPMKNAARRMVCTIWRSELRFFRRRCCLAWFGINSARRPRFWRADVFPCWR